MEYDKNLKRSVGKRVHDFRVQHDYTQAQFAEFMDISVNFLSEIENGKKGMSQETLYRLCQQFHLSSDYILFGITLEDAAKKPDTIIDIANHLSAEELTQVIEYLNSLKKMKMMKLNEFVNKKLHAIFHRASKQFKVDARDLACGYGCTFPLLYPLPGAAVGMTTLFPPLYPLPDAAVGMTTLFPPLYPPSGDTGGMATLFSPLYPPSAAAMGMAALFPLLYPLPGVLHTLTNSLTRPSLGGSFYICTSFLSTGLPHPAQLPLQPLHPPQHCPLLSLRSSPRTIKKTVIAIIVIIMMSAISASCPYLCSAFGYI